MLHRTNVQLLEPNMANPFLKKNPLMSMWLSSANAVAGQARGKATAAVKRQSAATVSQAGKEVAELWSASLGLTPNKRPKKRR